MSQLPHSVTLEPKQMFTMLGMNSSLTMSPSNSYIDYRELISRRKIEQNTKQYNMRYETKKGYYWDSMMKESSIKPPPNQYQVSKSLINNHKSTVKPKIDLKARKNSYIDLIEVKQKLDPVPGIGLYHLQQKPSKGIGLIQNSRKELFMDQFEALSNDIPGPGYYNPHFIKSSKSKSTLNPLRQTQKEHKKLSKVLEKYRLSPTACSYNPVDGNTFDQIAKQVQNKKYIAKSKRWGGAQRFTYNQKQLSKVRMPNPSPDHYKVQIPWGRGKKKHWVDILTTPRPSIYH